MSSLAQAYTYAMAPSPLGGTDIALTRLADGEVKRFYLANARPEHLRLHMDSLTDDCCEHFFPKHRAKAIKSPPPNKDPKQ